MSSEEDKWMKKQYPKLLKLLEARRVGQTNLIASSQSGGKALTRSDQKKIDISGDSNTSNKQTEANLYDDPTPGTSKGGPTKPPLQKAYRKTAQKNIVSKTKNKKIGGGKIRTSNIVPKACQTMRFTNGLSYFKLVVNFIRVF